MSTTALLRNKVTRCLNIKEWQPLTSIYGSNFRKTIRLYSIGLQIQRSLTIHPVTVNSYCTTNLKIPPTKIKSTLKIFTNPTSSLCLQNSRARDPFTYAVCKSTDAHNKLRLPLLSFEQRNYFSTSKQAQIFSSTRNNCKNEKNESSEEKVEKPGFFKRLFNRQRYSNAVLHRSGYSLYEQMVQSTDVLHFFKVLSLPDTYFSWFTVVELQVWLLSVRLMREGKEGKKARNSLIEAMWEDTGTKMSKLGRKSNNKRGDLEKLISHFQMAMVSYDEGLLGSDRDLAGAVWRTFIRRTEADVKLSTVKEEEDEEDPTPLGAAIDLNTILDPEADPRALESLVCYIRKQVHEMDKVDEKRLLKHGLVTTWMKPDLPSAFTPQE